MDETYNEWDWIQATIRVHGCDTYELNSKDSTDYAKAIIGKKVTELLLQNQFRIQNQGKGPWARIVASVYINGSEGLCDHTCEYSIC